MKFSLASISRFCSDHKMLKETLSKDSISKETDFSKIMILKGVSPHLQCPLCNSLIHEPRVLACSHTYCRECLEDAVRKTIKFSQFQNFANPSYKPSPSSDDDGDELRGTVPDTFSPMYTLEAFLGTPLNDELKSNLSQILSPEFTGIEHVPDKRVRNKKRMANAKQEASVESSSDCSKQDGLTESGTGSSSSGNGKTKKTNGTVKDRVKSQAGKNGADLSATGTGKGKSNGNGATSNPIKNGSRTSSANGAAKDDGVAGSSSEVVPLSASDEASVKLKPEPAKKLGPKDPNRILEVLVCPECGMHTEIPDGNISFIPYNFFVQHIMDLMTYYSSADPVPLVYCTLCRKDGVEDLPPAVARCSTCASFLCKQCFELHSIDDFTKLHSTLTITERGEASMFSCLTPGNSKVRTCKFHGHHPYVYYCISCSRGICETCSRREHRAHLFTRPEEIRSDFVTYIRDLMSRTSQLRRRTEGAVRTTQDLMSGIQLLAATQIEEVLRTQDVLVATLDMRLNVMMMEVDKVAKEGADKSRKPGASAAGGRATNARS